ncbi:MAG TPA: PepSY-associated TM helix domain-containing protein [Terriglobales bacterium]|nr:PepSY-associated TM helix domain-containing protein [Terriglobales bacterium]
MGFIDRPQRVWFRRALFQIHLWAGVGIGLYVIAISVSGSILVFQQDVLDDTRESISTLSNPVSFGGAVELAQRAHPEGKLLYIDNRNRNANIVSILLTVPQGTQVINVDRASGQLVDDSVRQQRHGVFSFLEDLHNELFSGSTGEKVNAVGGGLLLLMSLTGIVLWWPGQNNWRRALTVLWRARWPRVNFDLHVAFGFWTLLFVAMWGVTGLYFGFPFQFRKAIAVFTPIVEMPSVSHWKPGQPVRPVDQFIDKALSRFSGTELVFLTYSVHDSDGSIVVLLSRNRRIPLEVSRDIVYLHPSTLEILGTEESAHWTWGDKLLMWAYTVHFGDFGGLPTKLIWATLGLIPAGLTVTGYLMWWNRVLKKKWDALKQPGKRTREPWSLSRTLP